MRTWEQTVLGQPIRVQVRPLDEGWDVSVFGGVRTHVGAVTLAEPDGTAQTMERPGHKDSRITTSWALRLAAQWNAPVCVRCGIHYDHATWPQLQTIVEACTRLLEEVAQEGNREALSYENI